MPPIAADDWSIVSRRRGRRRPTSKPSDPSSSPLPLTPSPWSPTDSPPNPDGESRLLKLIQSTTTRLENSAFYRRFLSRLHSPHFQQSLTRTLHSQFQMVIYGIGSIETYPTPRLQIALALLLRTHLRISTTFIFDPILSATECAVLTSLNCTVLNVNEHARRPALSPTLFYMPHCEAGLYNNLLSTNWHCENLNNIVLLGNSFGAYERYIDEARGGGVSGAVGAAAELVLKARRFVKEVGLEEKEKREDGDEEVDGDDDGFFRAFHDMSWHFFEVDDGVELD